MKEKIKFWLIALVIGTIGGVAGSLIVNPKTVTQIIELPQNDQNTNSSFTKLYDLPDFTTAAANATDAVVNIKTESYQQVDDPLYNLFFGSPNVPMQGSGSGVIISTDGYIVTNNHVVENATNIKVTLNDKRELDAEIIGTDPTTDLALLKISANNLTVLEFGNSDNLKVGEWVLAIGNPYSLNSTVTAGIVSAKARNISILKQTYAIESFIQTDAAVNPGNSGGALINVSGYLIGINTAIASPTGSYTGYSFAIPVSIVKKIIADLIEFGSVQRAFLGARLVDIDEQIAQSYNLPNRKGVLITSVTDKGAAQDAGLKEEDVVLKLDSIEVNETSELLELLGRHRPGDIVTITARRDGNIKTFDVTLQNNKGGTVNNSTVAKADVFGATFEDLTDQEKDDYDIRNGVKVSKVMSGKFLSAGVRAGFVIQKINDRTVKTADDAKKILDNVSGGVYIEGFYPDTKKKAYYAFGVQ
ncbi:MAG: Do family serine endopeptidase [Bacteroidales bacterium]|nr:Do family serine endopeptidase [Bacteroidales bacterium]